MRGSNPLISTTQGLGIIKDLGFFIGLIICFTLMVSVRGLNPGLPD